MAALEFALLGLPPEDISNDLVAQGGEPITPAEIRQFLVESIPGYLQRPQPVIEGEKAAKPFNDKEFNQLFAAANPRAILDSQYLDFIVRLALLGIPSHDITAIVHKQYGEFLSPMEIQLFLDKHIPESTTYPAVHYEQITKTDQPQNYITQLEHLISAQEKRVKKALWNDSTRGTEKDKEQCQIEMQLMAKLLQMRGKLDALVGKNGGSSYGRTGQQEEQEQRPKSPVLPAIGKKVMKLFETLGFSDQHGGK